jgi:nitroreductase
MNVEAPVLAGLHDAVVTAVRAPSIRNTQPWRFRLYDGSVDVLGDRRRRLPVADPHGIGLRISCGAALFNLRLGIAHLGFEPETILLPDQTRTTLLATVHLGHRRPPTAGETALYEAIPRRASNHRPFLDRAVPLPVRTALRDAAQAEGCWLDFLVGPAAVAMAAELVVSADRVLNRDEAYLAELAQWPDPFVDPDPTELVGGLSDPVMAVLGTDADLPHDHLLAGQALQRMLLTTTMAGLVTSLFFQPIEVAAAREELRAGLRRRGWPSMLIRAGYGIPAPPTPRRELREVVIIARATAKSAR